MSDKEAVKPAELYSGTRDSVEKVVNHFCSFKATQLKALCKEKDIKHSQITKKELLPKLVNHCLLSWGKSELKKILQDTSLPLYGTKDHLVERIVKEVAQKYLSTKSDKKKPVILVLEEKQVLPLKQPTEEPKKTAEGEKEDKKTPVKQKRKPSQTDSPKKVKKQKIEFTEKSTEEKAKANDEKEKKDAFSIFFGNKSIINCPVCGQRDIDLKLCGVQTAYILPLANGGLWRFDNLVPSCGCNQECGTQNLIDFVGTNKEGRRNRLKKLVLALFEHYVEPGEITRQKNDPRTLIEFVVKNYKPTELSVYEAWLLLTEKDWIGILERTP